MKSTGADVCLATLPDTDRTGAVDTITINPRKRLRTAERCSLLILIPMQIGVLRSIRASGNCVCLLNDVFSLPVNLGRGVYESNLIRNTTSSIQLDLSQRIYLAARTDATAIVMDNGTH